MVKYKFPIRLSRLGAPPRNLSKLQLVLCSRYSSISSFMYIVIDTETKSGACKIHISINSPSTVKYLRFGAQIVTSKLSKDDNVRFSRRGQLEIRHSKASREIETC